MPQKIWPRNIEIPIVGVCGEHESGKTLFAMTVDPANTLFYDIEKSGTVYKDFVSSYVDLPHEARERHCGQLTELQLFLYWLEHIKNMREDTYSVIAVDPIYKLEVGLAEYVLSKHNDYGYKSRQSFLSTGGIFWSKAQREWENIIMDITSKCQTFVFTNHMKKEDFRSATSRRIAKGKAILRELATLYLYLERSEPNQRLPAAEYLGGVSKSRLAILEKDEGIVQVLPRRMPTASPQAIRDYINNPVGLRELKEEEKPRTKGMTRSEKLALEAKIAEDKRATAEAAAEAVATKERMSKTRQGSAATDGLADAVSEKDLNALVSRAYDVSMELGDKLKRAISQAGHGITQGQFGKLKKKLEEYEIGK